MCFQFLHVFHVFSRPYLLVSPVPLDPISGPAPSCWRRSSVGATPSHRSRRGRRRRRWSWAAAAGWQDWWRQHMGCRWDHETKVRNQKLRPWWTSQQNSQKDPQRSRIEVIKGHCKDVNLTSAKDLSVEDLFRAAWWSPEVTFSDCDARVLPLLRANCCDFSRRTGGPDLKVIKFDFASEQELGNGKIQQILQHFQLTGPYRLSAKFWIFLENFSLKNV